MGKTKVGEGDMGKGSYMGYINVRVRAEGLVSVGRLWVYMRLWQFVTFSGTEQREAVTGRQSVHCLERPLCVRAIYV